MKSAGHGSGEGRAGHSGWSRVGVHDEDRLTCQPGVVAGFYHARVGEAVAAERRRVAAGLQGAVAERTARLVRGAESGLTGRVGHAAALAEVTGEARRALAALRDLLDMFDAAGASAPAGRLAEVRG